LLQEYLSCPGQPSTTPRRRRPYQRYEEAVEYSAREHIATQKRPLSVFLFVKQGAFWISCAMPLFVPASVVVVFIILRASEGRSSASDCAWHTTHLLRLRKNDSHAWYKFPHRNAHRPTPDDSATTQNASETFRAVMHGGVVSSACAFPC
jgi:hypothetical protein